MITGASSGIGYDLAKIFASKGSDLVLVARSLDKLIELKKELEKDFSIQVLIIKQDLSIANSAILIYEELKHNNIQLDYLINNAGVGVFGPHLKSNLENEQKMIQLNITSLVDLTKLFIKDIVSKKPGKIMNVASVAAFMPGPQMSVYFATKAFVLSYSEALRSELKKYDITVTTLCPGGTNTNFFEGSTNKQIDKNMPTPKQVASYGYESMMKGQGISIYGMPNKFAVFFTRFISRDLILKIVTRVSKNF